MKFKNFKRLQNRLSLLEKCRKGLELFESGKYLVCLLKKISFVDVEDKFYAQINENNNIDGFYFSGKVLKKDMIIVSPEDFDEEIMEEIKSKQLKKKTEICLNKWIRKARKRLIYNMEILETKTQKKVKEEYENHLTKEQKKIFKISKKRMEEDMKTIWKDIYDINTHYGTPNEKNKNRQKKEDDSKNWDDVKEMISNITKVSSILDLGSILVADEKYQSQSKTIQHCMKCLKQLNEDEYKIVPNKTVATQTETELCEETESHIERYVFKETKEIETQTSDFLEKHVIQDNFTQTENIVSKTSRLLSEIDPDLELGEPFSKRTNELENVYNEINRTILRSQKSNTNIRLETPPVTYIGYSGFNILSTERQQELLSHYKGHASLLKDLVKLCNVGICKENERLFLEKMRNDEKLISSLDSLLKIIIEERSKPSDEIEEINLKMIQGTVTDIGENTLPESSIQQSLTIEEDILNKMFENIDLEFS